MKIFLIICVALGSMGAWLFYLSFPAQVADLPDWQQQGMWFWRMVPVMGAIAWVFSRFVFRK